MATFFILGISDTISFTCVDPSSLTNRLVVACFPANMGPDSPSAMSARSVYIVVGSTWSTKSSIKAGSVSRTKAHQDDIYQ